MREHPEFGALYEWTEEAWLSPFWLSMLDRIAWLPKGAAIPDDPVLVDAGLTVEDEVAVARIRSRCSTGPFDSKGWSSTDWAHWEHLHRVETRDRRVVEFGGGYGNMARIAHLGAERWTIVDHPIMLSIQARYLTEHRVPWSVWRPGLAAAESGVVLAPSGPEVLDELASEHARPDVFISTFALSETTGGAVEHVVSRDWLSAPSVLIALDHSKCRVFPATQVLVDALEDAEATWEPADWPGSLYALIETR